MLDMRECTIIGREARSNYLKCRRNFGSFGRVGLCNSNSNNFYMLLGDVVLDVGAAPGSWCQVLKQIIFPENVKIQESVFSSGYILGVDLQVR